MLTKYTSPIQVLASWALPAPAIEDRVNPEFQMLCEFSVLTCRFEKRLMSDVHVKQRNTIRVFLSGLMAVLTVLSVACGDKTSSTSSTFQGETLSTARGVANGPGDPPSDRSASPEVSLSTIAADLSEEEDAQIRATAEAKSTGVLTHVTGTETAGSLIVIAGREIQLPADTWVKDRVIYIYCVEGQECPPTPYFVLHRGKSIIEVDAAGKIWGETISPDEMTPFAFLKDLLQ